MARPGFLNDNTYRAYPFQPALVGSIPDCAIADFGSTALAGSGYVEGTHDVWLEWIRRLGDTLEFSFRTNAPGLADQALIFQRDVNDAEFATSYSWAQPALTAGQLAAACTCGVNLLCNGSFDEQATTTTTSTTGDPCDKYPGSAVYGWSVDSGVTQDLGYLKFVAPAFTVLTGYQEVTGFSAGETVRMLFDVVSNNGNSSSFIVAELAGPTQSEVFAVVTASVTGSYELTGEVPSTGSVFVTFKAYNAAAAASMTVELDDASLHLCVSDTSSYAATAPAADVCPAGGTWEGYLVTGDLSCLAADLVDCSITGPGPGSTGELDVLLLTDSTAGASDLISVLQAQYESLADNVVSLLPGVDIRWAVVSYKDFADGGAYASGYSIEQQFTATTSLVGTALGSLTASGGSAKNQQLSALAAVTTNWTTALSGRSAASKLVIWAGVTAGEEGSPYPSLTDTSLALRNAGIRVIAFNSGAAGAGLDGIDVSGERQASQITSTTVGYLVNSLDFSDTEETIDAISDYVLLAYPPAGVAGVQQLSGPAYVEPTLTRNLDLSYVRSLAIANADRTRATPPDGCRDICWPFDLADHYVICQCLAGDVVLEAGCNSNIRIDTVENAIVIDGEVGAGDCDCDLPAVTYEEAKPAGLSSIDGATLCSEVIRSFNGSGGKFFELRGRQGVTITPVPDEHRIIIDVNLGDLALCPDLADDEIVACIPPDTDPCGCGPASSVSFSCPEGATTSTTADPAVGSGDAGCGGPCVWVWNQSPGDSSASWVLASGACNADCSCASPHRDGRLIGEELQTACLSDIVCGLVNPEFATYTLNGDNEVSTISGWTVVAGPATSDGVIVASVTGFASHPILNQGVVLRLLATADGDAEIEQAFSATAGATISVTAYVNDVRGDTSWGVKDDATVLTPTATATTAGITGDAGQFVTKTYLVPVTPSLKVFFSASSKLTFDGRGVLDVAGVCVVQIAGP